MGEAIAANLKTKTGKTLDEWLRAVSAQGLTEQKAIVAWLKEQGLGHIQARLVADRWAGQPLYDNPEQLITSLFDRYPDQYALWNTLMERFRVAQQFDINPCKGYVPLYTPRGRIFASFKPMRDGLYLGLTGTDFDFATIPHKLSRGGADSMTRGLFVESLAPGLRALQAAYQSTHLTQPVPHPSHR